MILEDLKNYMSQTVEDTAVYLNYDSSIKREDAVLLWLNASSVSDVGEKAAVRVVAFTLLAPFTVAPFIAGNIIQLGRCFRRRRQ